MSTRRPPVALSALLSLSFASLAAAQVDWRAAQSPVKDQGRRGTCAAFAICGALETFPGFPGDLSEQLLYATLKLDQNAIAGMLKQAGLPATQPEGDLFDAYIGLFELLGTCHESFLPYDPNPKKAGPEVPEDLRRYLALAHITPADLGRMRDGYGKYGFRRRDCEVFDAAAAKDVETFKKLLAKGTLAIPVGYRVHAPSWSKLAEVGNSGPDGKKLFVHPGMMEKFSRDGVAWLSYGEALIASLQAGEDFATAVHAGGWQRQPIGEQKEYGGHAVLLVGWDDRGFLAKNSWGTDWGDGGYFRVAWDYHRLYAINALVIGKSVIRIPSLNPFETTGRIGQGRFRVKLQARGAGRDEHWLLSTWMQEPREAGYERLEYRVDGQAADGQWRELARQVVDAGGDWTRTGAPFALGGEALAAARTSQAVRLELRVGRRGLNRPKDLADNEWLRTLSFPPFAPQLDRALDLVPQ